MYNRKLLLYSIAVSPNIMMELLPLCIVFLLSMGLSDGSKFSPISCKREK